MTLQKTKLLIGCLSLIGLMSTYAGGSEWLSETEAPVSTFRPYIYAEVGAGYAQTGYGDYYNSTSWIDTSDLDGGMSYQGSVGFALMPRISAELGLGMLPKAEFELYESSLGYKVSASYESWYGYLQGKYDFKITDRLGVFAKAGIAYRSLSYEYNGNLDGAGLDDYYWAPIVGGGFSFDLGDDFYALAEYSYIDGTSDSNEGESYPDVNLYLAKLGYRFTF